MGYCLNCLDKPVFSAVPKPLLTEFGIHHRLESCASCCYLIRSTNLIDIRLPKMHFVINLRESLKACQNQMIVVISDIVDFFNIFKLKCFKRR